MRSVYVASISAGAPLNLVSLGLAGAVKRFRVIVHGMFGPGEAHPGDFERGFYTARSVETTSEAEAVRLAFSSVGEDPRILRQAEVWGSAEPKLLVEEIIDLEHADFDESLPGVIFYDESSPN